MVKKAQAAVFDGITLMLLASLSAALIFSFIGSYGVQESRVIRSAYVLNYMQSVMKAFYYLDASTLKEISNEEKDARGTPYRISLYEDLNDLKKGCRALAEYPGSITVTDLLKRDLAEQSKTLDNQFDGAEVLGLTAVRCAMKELIKPFAYSGYYYGFDVIWGTDSVLFPEYKKAVTNYLKFTQAAVPKEGLCKASQGESGDVLSVSTPFKVVFINPDATPPIREIVHYEIRLCIWRPKT